MARSDRRQARAAESGDHWARLAVVVVLAVLVGACSGSSSGAPRVSSPPVITVTLTEYRLEYNPVVPSGRVVFRLVNAGRIAHRPSLFPLTEDIPPIDQQVRGEQRAAITPFAGVPDRDPGEVGTFAVDLQPGQRYAFVCFARDADDGEAHAVQGMTSEFRPPADDSGTASTSTSPPAAETEDDAGTG